MIFDSQYQIVAMPMIEVSDIKLARATAAAGIVPSLNTLNYDFGNMELSLLKDLREFNNDGNILLNFLANRIYQNYEAILKILKAFKVKYILLQYGDSTINKNRLFDLVKRLKENDIKVFVSEHYNLNKMFPGIFDISDGVFVKGPGVAGICRQYDNSLVEAVRNFRNQYDVPVIAVGGIGDKRDIDDVLEAGASAVGIGTLFAVSKESSIADETKLRMVSSSSSDLIYLPVSKPEDPNYDGKQKALFFSEYSDKRNDIRNRNGLMLGVKNQGGHVYAGDGIDKVDEVLTVQEIVNRLVGLKGVIND